MRKLIIIFLILLSRSVMGQDLIASYSESNYSTDLKIYNGSYTMMGESFVTTGAVSLGSVKWYIKKSGTPTGNINAVLYAHAGSYGNSSVGTGSALATSDNFDVSTLTTSYQLIQLNFSGANQYALAATTDYVIVLKYTGGDASNYVYMGLKGSSGGYSGNMTRYQSSWVYSSGADMCFYVYTPAPAGTASPPTGIICY